jgi:hypothetical protein
MVNCSESGRLAGITGFGLGALQFLRLPHKAGTLNDRAMVRSTPGEGTCFTFELPIGSTEA